MKKIILAIALLSPFCANAINMNIGYPGDAARISLYGETTAKIDCKNKTVEIVESSNIIFSKFVEKNKSAICYRDSGSYNVKFVWDKSSKQGRNNIIATQSNRFLKDHNTISM